MSKIKYFIWDVGQVIYEYNLNALHKYCKSDASFNYNDYMKGLYSFDELCDNLRKFYKKTLENIKLHQCFF